MSAKPPPTEAELQKLAERILADPNTAKIAEQLNVPLEEYVQTVMAFYLDPKAEPEFAIISDANLEKMGAPPPKVEDMAKYLQNITDQRFARARSTFEDAPPEAREAAKRGRKV